MTDQIPTAMPRSTPLPPSDDPVVLRELLSQANDRLAAVASLETMLMDHQTRTQAMLAVSTAAAATPNSSDPGVLAAVDRLRFSLAGALDELDALRELLTPASPRADDPEPEPIATAASIDTSVPIGISRTDIVIHGVATPALARAVQRHLAAAPGVDRADVRELVDGLLRVTVSGSDPIGADALSGWEPDRSREVRAEAPGVLEIELLPGSDRKGR